MAQNALSSAGVTVQYAIESTSGVRPASGYTIIPGVKATPDFNPEPSALDATDLSEPEYKQYISGLKDVGGTLGLTVNLTDDFMDTWDDIIAEYDAGQASSKSLWLAIVIPKLAKAFYFSAVPSPLGLSAIEVDSVLELDSYVAPAKVAGWLAKPTTTP